MALFAHLQNVDSWPKILLFRTHHRWNSTSELILTYIYILVDTSSSFKTWILLVKKCVKSLVLKGIGICKYSRWERQLVRNDRSTVLRNRLQFLTSNEFFPCLVVHVYISKQCIERDFPSLALTLVSMYVCILESLF